MKLYLSETEILYNADISQIASIVCISRSKIKLCILTKHSPHVVCVNNRRKKEGRLNPSNR